MLGLGKSGDTNVACRVICALFLQGHSWEALGWAFRIQLVGILEAALDRLKVQLTNFCSGGR